MSIKSTAEWFFSRFLAVLHAVVVVSGCQTVKAPAPDEPGEELSNPNVLIITLDTTRADRIGAYGYPLARTPNIDRLAAQGVRFDNATTAVPITLPSHSTIMTGLLPPAHGVRDNGVHALNDDVVTLAERLESAGYRTAAFVSALVLDSRYNLDQGFDLYEDDLWSEDQPEMFLIRDRAAPKTARLVTHWLGQRQKAGEKAPFFIWTHFFDPHQPYEARVRDRWKLPSQYDAEIAQADLGVGIIIDKLEEMGELDSTFIVVVADHGESLGEHEEQTHALFVYDATVRVPLIMRYPPEIKKETVYGHAARTVDITPTVLGALGLPGGERTQGSDLLPVIQGESEPPLLSQYVESLLTESGFGMAPLFGVRREGYKYIRAPRPELYNLARDPKELRNLYAEKRELARRLDKELDAILEASEKNATVSTVNPLDRETREMLQALGYLVPDADRQSMNGIDPKDGIELHNEMQEARQMARRNRWSEAERMLGRIIEKAPKNTSAQNLLALVLTKQKRLDEAEQQYVNSLAVDPKQSRVYISLANLNLRRGRLEKAEQLCRKGLELVPDHVEGLVLLGGIAAENGRGAEAKKWYDKAVEIDPSAPSANHRFADLYFEQADYEAALGYYEKTLVAAPHHFQALNQAGVASKRLGRPDAAEHYFTRAAELRPDSWIPPYNLACLRALGGDARGAEKLLAEAVSKAYGARRLVNGLFKDPDLRLLREKGALTPLLRQARADAKSRLENT